MGVLKVLTLAFYTPFALHSNKNTHKMGAQYTTVRPEEEYPSLCVCASSGKDHCNLWKNVFCGCFTSKKIATEAGLSNGMAWGCCVGIACFGPCGSIAHGAIVTQKLREKHGFQKAMACGVISHWCCCPCALTQEEHLINSAQRKIPTGPQRQGM